MPLVSVGIPTYNRPAGLRRTLVCITGQTYQNLEIIVSDNCSPGPETEQVVSKFLKRDPRIQYYRQEKNVGAANNFSFVLKKASGDFYLWASDDDEWYPNYIERCMSELSIDDSIILCASHGIIISDVHYQLREVNSQFLGPNPFWLDSEDKHTHGLPAMRRVKKTILNSGVNICFYGLYRTFVLKQQFFHPSYDPHKFGSDRSFIARLNLIGSIYQISEPLFVYHHGMGASSGMALTMKNQISRWEYYGLRINPLLTAYINMIIDSLSWPISITDHIRVIGYYLARMAKAKIMRYTVKTPFVGTPLYDYKPPEYPPRNPEN